jgi:hypothetical protein
MWRRIRRIGSSKTPEEQEDAVNARYSDWRHCDIHFTAPV